MSTVSSLHAYGLHCWRYVLLWLIARVCSSTVITRAHTRHDGPVLSSRNLAGEKIPTRRFLQILHPQITVFSQPAKPPFRENTARWVGRATNSGPVLCLISAGDTTTGWQVAECCGVRWRLFFWLMVVFQVRYRVFPTVQKYDITYGITRYIDS